MSGQIIEDIVITAFGTLSPVGANTEQTCASIRAGITAFSEYTDYECIPADSDQDEELPLYTASVPIIDPYLDGPERLYQLAIPALNELIHSSQFKPQDTANSGLFLALPQLDSTVSSWQLDSKFIPQLCQRLNLPDFKASRINQTGRTSVFSLIDDAIKLLTLGQLDYCIVGGVDSWLFNERLNQLDAAWRIKTDRNVDGFIPGEAAAMLMLETASHATTRKAAVIARISAIGSGDEPETIYSDKVSTGQGLTEALNGVLQSKTTAQAFEFVYCDMNGESYSAFEWGLMLSRLGTTFKNVKKLTHPADCCGDVGAASGSLLLACASTAFQQEQHMGDESLLWTSSDSGQRMALTLQRAEG